MSTFARILVGIDGTDWGFEALRQALLLFPRRDFGCSGGDRTRHRSRNPRRLPRRLFRRVAHEGGGGSARRCGEDHRQSSGKRSRRAWQDGRRASAGARRVACHARCTRRQTEQPVLGIMLGDTGTELLHDAVCSVLLARPTREEIVATSQNRRRARQLEPRHSRRYIRQTSWPADSTVRSRWCLRRAGSRSIATPRGRIEFRAGIARMRPTHSSSGRTPPTSSSSDHAVCTVSAHSEASVSASHTRRTARCLSSRARASARCLKPHRIRESRHGRYG